MTSSDGYTDLGAASILSDLFHCFYCSQIHLTLGEDDHSEYLVMEGIGNKERGKEGMKELEEEK